MSCWTRAAHLTWSVVSELDDMEGIEDAGGVLELIVDGVLSVPGRDPPSRSGYRSETVRRAWPASSHARCPTFPGPGPLTRAVGCSSPRVVHDASELTGAPTASVLVIPHVLINPQHPNPRKTGRVIRCGSQTRLDTGPHGIPRSCQLSSQASYGGSLETQLSDRPADRPGAQTRPGAHIRSSCSRNVTVWQVVSRHIQRRLNHRNLARTPAQGASITSTTTRPWP